MGSFSERDSVVCCSLVGMISLLVFRSGFDEIMASLFFLVPSVKSEEE